MIRGLFYHTLKGHPGWSKCSHKSIDVARVVEVNYTKRLFMLTDRHLPYSLSIVYDEPTTEARAKPVWTSGGVGIALGSDVVQEQVITKRYATLEEAEKEVEEIKSKQTSLKAYCEKMGKQILEEYTKNNRQ